MKILKSIILAMGLVLANSCTLDLREDPNAVQPNQSLPNLVLNSMQRNMAGMFNTLSTFGMQMTRLQNSGGSLYSNVYSPETFDGVYRQAYASILQDADVLLKQADASGLARHAGIARIIQAYTLLAMVDNFGDIPFSEAFQGSDNFNPALESSSQVYTTIFGILDKAKQDLTTTSIATGGYLNATAPIPTDSYYFTHVGARSATAIDYNKWIRAANSIKLKMYLNLRLKDPATARSQINALIIENQIISTADQNFVFRYGTNIVDPDNRHPRFVATYPAGSGNYMSNWLMWHMFHGYDAQHNGGNTGDPRMRFYFYRQRGSNSSDPNEIRCATAASPPEHYPKSSGAVITLHPKAGLPPGIAYDPSQPMGASNPNPLHPAWLRTFCFPSDRGYWGRDHVDPQGIPPDGFARTMWGAYPAGGRFDANVNGPVRQTQGMQGAGLQPILMRSNVQFILAEAALYLGTGGGAISVPTHFTNGIRFSMDDVRTFAVLGRYDNVIAAPTTESSTINSFYPSNTFNTDVDAYVTRAVAAYNAQTTNDTRMNYIAREHWIASFGNGLEAYNLYRRTGMPTGMQPTLNENPGTFPRTHWYPAVLANLNSNVNQKADLSGLVFWDVNTVDLGF